MEDEGIGWRFMTDVKELQDTLTFWHKRAKELEEELKFYKDETAQTQEILGRVISQYSEKWDTVKLTNYPRERLK